MRARTRGKHASGPPAYQGEMHFHSSSHRLQASASSPPLDGFGTSWFVNEGPTRPISSTTMPRPAGKRTAGQDESFIGSVSRFWNRSYVADYVGFALLLLAYSLVGSAMTRNRVSRLTLAQIQVLVEPFHRMFSLDNISIQYPHAAVERVPVSM